MSDTVGCHPWLMAATPSGFCLLDVRYRGLSPPANGCHPVGVLSVGCLWGLSLAVVDAVAEEGEVGAQGVVGEDLGNGGCQA